MEDDLKDWRELEKYFLTEGSARYLDGLKQMPDSEFIKHWLSISEFFRPKIVRSSLEELHEIVKDQGLQIIIVEKSENKPKKLDKDVPDKSK